MTPTPLHVLWSILSHETLDFRLRYPFSGSKIDVYSFSRDKILPASFQGNRHFEYREGPGDDLGACHRFDILTRFNS